MCVHTCVCTCVRAQELGSARSRAPGAAERVPGVSPSSPARPWQPRQLCPCFAQPVLQPEELIFYLSSFEMLIEDALGSKACWPCRGVQPRPGALGGWGVRGCASRGVTGAMRSVRSPRAALPCGAPGWAVALPTHPLPLHLRGFAFGLV